MAKKRLGVPRVPEGPQREFFLMMQRLVVLVGDPSLRELAKKLTMQKRALHLALVGPDIPDRHKTAHICDQLSKIASALDPPFDTTELRRDILLKWADAVTDQRTLGLTQAEAKPPSGTGQRSGDKRREFAQELKAAKARVGLPTRMLAKQSGVPVGTLAGWLAGNALPMEAWDFDRLLNVLDVPKEQKQKMRDLYVAARDERLRPTANTSARDEFTTRLGQLYEKAGRPSPVSLGRETGIRASTIATWMDPNNPNPRIPRSEQDFRAVVNVLVRRVGLHPMSDVAQEIMVLRHAAAQSLPTLQ
ncbi:hypothetical protein [Nocardia fluminea]|uniref:hypothetical protein n=1 Tax=Nocardia fluminea TaxID=134984 RepID=UPI00343C4113